MYAAMSGLLINYQVGSGTDLPFDDGGFEAVSCCDVLEHIPQWEQVIVEVGRMLKPGGLFFIDTINRTKKSREVLIKGLQEFSFTKLMPVDTHIWEMFITPEELTGSLRKQGLIVKDLCGGKIPKNPAGHALGCAPPQARGDYSCRVGAEVGTQTGPGSVA